MRLNSKSIYSIRKQYKNISYKNNMQIMDLILN